MNDLELLSTAPAIHNVEYEKDYFTRTGYEGYMDYPFNEIRTQKIINMTHPKSVLDVGGAYGFIAKRLRDKGVDAWCMDVSNWCCDQNIVPGYFVVHDMRNTPYPFKDKQFDVVYCEGVLEHIEDKYVEAVMKEFERISHERILALTFDFHVKERPYSPDNPAAPGHINLHNVGWWFDRIPDYTWIFLPPTGTQDSKSWIYKC